MIERFWIYTFFLSISSIASGQGLIGSFNPVSFGEELHEISVGTLLGSNYNTSSTVLENNLFSIESLDVIAGVQQTKEFTIFPNPVTDSFQIKSGQLITKIEIVDTQGKIIDQKLINDVTTVHTVSEIPVDIYILFIHYENGEVGYHKIIKR
jgi:hypothetical protein